MKIFEKMKNEKCHRFEILQLGAELWFTKHKFVFYVTGFLYTPYSLDLAKSKNAKSRDYCISLHLLWALQYAVENRLFHFHIT